MRLCTFHDHVTFYGGFFSLEYAAALLGISRLPDLALPASPRTLSAPPHGPDQG
jgi:hypothetical protein